MVIAGLSLPKLWHYPKNTVFLFTSFLAPVVVMAYLLLSSSNESIRFVDRELHGLSYMERLRKPLQHLLEHRGMTGAFGRDDEGIRATMKEKEAIIDQGFSSLEGINRMFGDDLSIGGRIDDMRRKWAAIKTHAFAVNDLDVHDRLIVDFIVLFGHIVDASGLIQEPTLDGFYMVDVIGNQLPRLMDRIEEVRAIGVQAAANGPITADARLKLTLGLERIKERNRHLEHDLNSILRVRGDLKARIGGGDATSNVRAFCDLLSTELLEPSNIHIAPATVFEGGEKAINNVIALYDQVFPALDALLRSRVNENRQQRLITIGVVLVVLVFAAYFLTARNRLERLIEERTRELNATNRELEAFSYTVSHDLRAPLRAINGFSEILREESSGHLSDEASSCLIRIRSASERMGQLIDGLLTLSRVRRCAILREQVDLSAMAHGIIAGLREGDPDRRVVFEIASGLTTVGDGKLLQVALENLFANAWKFTEKRSEACISFGGCGERDEGQFYVLDNGVGFDMQLYDRLFEPFERLHEEREFGGTGIGLATVRRIVERHGGRVRAIGAPGEGAIFYFTIGRMDPPS